MEFVRAQVNIAIDVNNFSYYTQLSFVVTLSIDELRERGQEYAKEQVGLLLDEVNRAVAGEVMNRLPVEPVEDTDEEEEGEYDDWDY